MVTPMPLVKKRVMIQLDAKKNDYRNDGAIHDVSADGSKVRILVIPTNEELVIARETAELI